MAALAMTATVLPTASARPLRSSMAKQLVEAKRNGASKTEIKKLKEKIKDEMRTARAAGVSMDVSLFICRRYVLLKHVSFFLVLEAHTNLCS